MHVALCSPAWPLDRHHNGIVTYVHWTKLELERLGHRVSVFTGTADDDDDVNSVYKVERPFLHSAIRRVTAPFFSEHRNVFDWGKVIAAAMLDLHRRHPIDIVEMEETFGWSADIGRITSLPVLVKLHGPSFLSLVEEELATPFGRECVEREGWALRQAAAIASPCRITMKQTIERYHLAPSIAQHIVNPLTMDPTTPRWSLDQAERDTILFVGRFDKRKGGDLVIEALASLLKTRPTLKLVFVGPDAGLTQPDGSLMHIAQFIEATLAEGLRERVEFKGRLPQRDIIGLRTRATMTIVASRWENQSYTSLEAMFQGCPIVSSDTGGCPEIIAHGRTGLLARNGDSVDLAAKIAEMLDSPDTAAAMGAAAREYVSEFHSASRVAAQSLELYERVIAKRSANRR